MGVVSWFMAEPHLAPSGGYSETSLVAASTSAAASSSCATAEARQTVVWNTALRASTWINCESNRDRCRGGVSASEKWALQVWYMASGRMSKGANIETLFIPHLSIYPWPPPHTPSGPGPLLDIDGASQVGCPASIWNQSVPHPMKQRNYLSADDVVAAAENDFPAAAVDAWVVVGGRQQRVLLVRW